MKKLHEKYCVEIFMHISAYVWQCDLSSTFSDLVWAHPTYWDILVCVDLVTLWNECLFERNGSELQKLHEKYWIEIFMISYVNFMCVYDNVTFVNLFRPCSNLLRHFILCLSCFSLERVSVWKKWLRIEKVTWKILCWNSHGNFSWEISHGNFSWEFFQLMDLL